MDIVGGIIAEDEREIPAQTGEDEAASLLYGDDSVVIRMESPEMKNLNYVILKSPTQQSLTDSYRTNLWNATPQIKKKLRELCQQNEVMAFVIVNGSRHFHGYLMIENDNEEYAQLNEEEAKLKPLCVRWMRLCHVPYHKTTSILNSLNDDLPVKLTSNGNVRALSSIDPSDESQEISADCATQLLELIDSEPEETLDTQKEKLRAHEESLTSIFTEQFELPNEDDPQGDNETDRMNVEKDRAGNENGAKAEDNATGANKENSKRRGRSRSHSAERGEFRRSKTGGSYLDLFDIVNMTYEEYLEAYRLLQMRAHEEFMMSMQQHEPMNMNMGPPGMMPPHHMHGHMPPPGHFPDPFFHHNHSNMGPPHMGMGPPHMGMGPPHMGMGPPHMMGGMMMHGPPHGPMGGRGGRGF